MSIDDDMPPPTLEEARRRAVDALMRVEDERDNALPMCDRARDRRALERRARFHVVR